MMLERDIERCLSAIEWDRRKMEERREILENFDTLLSEAIEEADQAYRIFESTERLQDVGIKLLREKALKLLPRVAQADLPENVKTLIESAVNLEINLLRLLRPLTGYREQKRTGAAEAYQHVIRYHIADVPDGYHYLYEIEKADVQAVAGNGAGGITVSYKDSIGDQLGVSIPKARLKLLLSSLKDDDYRILFEKDDGLTFEWPAGFVTLTPQPLCGWRKNDVFHEAHLKVA